MQSFDFILCTLLYVTTMSLVLITRKGSSLADDDDDDDGGYKNGVVVRTMKSNLRTP